MNPFDSLSSAEPILVSACLIGVHCRFDAGTTPHPRVLALAQVRTLIPVCPEQLGGLPTPRPRHERVLDRVVSEFGQDATDLFLKGALQAVLIARLLGCKTAILKARSPSCGSGLIYDGTFSGALVPGDGVATTCLRKEGIRVFSEEEFQLGNGEQAMGSEQ